MRPPKVVVPSPPPSPLPPILNEELMAALLSHTPTIANVQQSLLAECRKIAWLEKAQERIYQLLREDETRDYNEVLRILIKESTSDGDRALQKEEERGNIEEQGKVADVKLPKRAIDEAIRIVKEGLESIVEFEGGID